MVVNKFILLAFTFLSTYFCLSAAAEPITGTDVSIKFGTVSGSFAQTNDDKTVTKYTFGGIPLIMALNSNLGEDFYMNFGFGLVADITNFEITRVGAHSGLAYHLLGGSRQVMKEYGSSQVIIRYPYNVSLGVRFSLNHYDASSKIVPAHITVSDFETAAGLEFRFDYSEHTSFAFEIYNGLLYLPLGNANITPSTMEFWISYRIFL